MDNRLRECLACGNSDLYEAINLGNQPLANCFQRWPGDAEVYPLQTMFCKKCFHLQLSHSVDPPKLFDNYVYVTGTSNTLTKHMAELAKELIVPEEHFKRVLDIGCNDGTLMREFLKIDPTLKVWGVDPAQNLKSQQEGLFILQTYWAQGCMYFISEAHKFDLITAINCFAHNPDPLDFMLAIREALTEDGTAVIEQPYAPVTFGNGQFDQIYHEHYSYWSVNSFKALCKRAGMNIDLCYRTPMHGGSMRFFVSKAEHGDWSAHSVDRYIKDERLEGYGWYSTQKRYAEEAYKTIAALENELKEFDLASYDCIAYGASAKFSVIVNTFKYRGSILRLVVDDNKLKQGLYVPGTHLLVYPPDDLKRAGRNLLIFCGAHNMKEEISSRIRGLRPDRKEDMLLTYWNGHVRAEKIWAD